MKKPQERELADDLTQPSQPREEEPPEAAENAEEAALNLENVLGGDDADEEPEEQGPPEPDLEDLPEKVWPTLDEYKARWDAGLARHSRPNAGPFNRDNLVPDPIHQLWQDAPALVRQSTSVTYNLCVRTCICRSCTCTRCPMCPSTN